MLKRTEQTSFEPSEPRAEIIAPSDKVLLIDLDGTLIDTGYQVNTDEIFDAVRAIQEAGWFVGLSSDTPLVPLQNWKAFFGMNGDIIAERGSIIQVGDSVLDAKEDVSVFQSSLANMKDHFSALGCQLWTGDTVDFLRNNSKFGTPGETVILINEHRTQSIGLYVRRVMADGSLAIDSGLTNYIVESSRAYFPEVEDLNVDLNHDYGILILSRKSVIKRAGTLNLITQRRLAQVGMIGNSMTDFVGSDIAVHYAVGSSTPEFKAKADFVATRSVTAGVVDILRKLQESQI